MDKYSRENGYISEYDNYEIHPYDPSIPTEERKKRLAEVQAELDALLEQATSGLFD